MPGPALTAALRATTLEAARAASRYDAVVIGAGAAGGMAAMLLTEAGLRVLVLDAGAVRSPVRSFSRRVVRGLTRRILGDCRSRGSRSAAAGDPNSVLRVAAARRRRSSMILIALMSRRADRPFVWLRARQLGGRWLIPGHGRQYYRLGPNDLAPPDGLSAPWPLQAGELDPWYAAVERRLGLSGRRDNLPWLPDGELKIVLEPTPAEAALQHSISARWPGAAAVLGRFAAPFDALEAAARTGRLFIRSGAIAREIEVDGSGRVRGVVWIDQQSRTEQRASAPLVFLCASALESTRLLLLSRSARSPDGLGARSGVLGRYLMDHVFVRVAGERTGAVDRTRSRSRSLPLPSPLRRPRFAGARSRPRLRRADYSNVGRRGRIYRRFLRRDAAAAREPRDARPQAAGRLGHPGAAHRLQSRRSGTGPRSRSDFGAAGACRGGRRDADAD